MISKRLVHAFQVRIFQIVFLSFGFVSALALAGTALAGTALTDPAEDLALGEVAFNREDLMAAMTLFTKAAKQGYAPAQLRLGEILDASDYDKEAVDWYRKAAVQGYAAGEYRLANMYLIGEGVEKNAGKGLYWLKLAAEKDYIPALRSLAQANRYGELGLAINLDEAAKLEKQAVTLDAAARKPDAATETDVSQTDGKKPAAEEKKETK